MNSTPFKKRNNPLDTGTQKQQTPIQPQPEVSVVENPAPAVVQPAAPTRKTSTKTVVIVEERVKYTATMEKGTRRRLKLAAAKRDIQISEFIEAAVLEKLEREGD